MALDLKTPGKTFTITDADLVTGGDPDTSYTVRYFTADDAQRLHKAAFVAKQNPETRRMEEQFDPAIYGSSVLDYLIVDWTGIEADGQPLPCLIEYKRALPENRRTRLLALAQDNVEVKAKRKEDSFRTAEGER